MFRDISNGVPGESLPAVPNSDLHCKPRRQDEDKLLSTQRSNQDRQTRQSMPRQRSVLAWKASTDWIA